MNTLIRIAGGVATAVLLAGCSLPGLGVQTPSGGSSTVAVTGACGALAATLGAAPDTLGEALAEAGTDPKKSLKTLEDFIADFQAAVAEVDDPEVKAQAGRVLTALQALGTAVNDATGDPTRVAALPGALAAVQQELGELTAACTG